jgi:hypothetical protein
MMVTGNKTDKCITSFCETRTKRSVEVYRGKNLHPLRQTATDIAAKSNSAVGILRKMIDCKIAVFDPFPGSPVTCYYKHFSLLMHTNSM